MAESKMELKSLLMKMKKESEKKNGLKLNIQKTKIMASSPDTSWQIDVERVETVTDFILGGSRITADGDWGHKIKLAPWTKSYNNPRHCMKRQRHHLADKGLYIQCYSFSSSHVWM